MDHLNYHHLHYFWLVTEEGSLSDAARRVRLTHSTLSTQLRALEASLGGALFERRGRRLVLTPFGQDVREYAADIFRLGRELLDVAGGQRAARRKVLRVGVVGTMPKSLTYELLAPALSHETPVRLTVRQDSLSRLTSSLSAGRLDLALTDELPSDRSGAVHTHVLGETEILVFGARALATRHRKKFPASLDDAPFVMPSSGTTLRRLVDQWLLQHGISVSVIAEVDDAALLRVFGVRGHALFPVREMVRKEVEDLHDMQMVGACEGLRERYYALTVERRVRDPVVASILEGAREKLHAPRERRAPRGAASVQASRQSGSS